MSGLSENAKRVVLDRDRHPYTSAAYPVHHRISPKLDRIAELEARLGAVQAIHSPIEALMYTGPQQRLVNVCTGCGTDDGNWQLWPCPTVKALTDPI